MNPYHHYANFHALLESETARALQLTLLQKAKALVIEPGQDLLSSGLQFDILRLDAVADLVSGNKYFKLAPYLALAQQLGLRQLLSFGGAYSNHVHALAAACRDEHLKAIAVIRGGERPTATMNDAQAWGASLRCCSRIQYRNKYQASFIAQLEHEYGDFLLVPEGGGGVMGAWGCRALGLALAPKNYDVICLAAGTGSTAAGLISGLAEAASAAQVVVVPVLKRDSNMAAAEGLEADIDRLLFDLAETGKGSVGREKSWLLRWGFECGGYGKCPPSLQQKIIELYRQQGLKLDPVYTAKSFFCLQDILANEPAYQGKKILFIHTGGLQGSRGYPGLKEIL